MANFLMDRILKSIPNLNLITTALSSGSAAAAAEQPQSDGGESSSSSSFTFSSEGQDSIHNITASSWVTMPMSFMTGSVVGKRFYNQVTTRKADDGNGWSVMLDYRTLKTPSKRPLKLPTLGLAKAIAAEWEYQALHDAFHEACSVACTALERVPITRHKVIEYLINRFNQDLVFCRAPDDNELTSGIHVDVLQSKCSSYKSPFMITERQVEKIDPLPDLLESEFGFKPVVYSCFFGGKHEDGLLKAVETLLKKTDECELAAIDAIAGAAHSLTIALGLFRGKLQIKEAIELIRLEEDFQGDKWGMVEGGHDVDIADLKVQITSAAVFLGLSRRV
ncbi:putative ATP12, ATP synthase F1-assembly protein [Rosa chinensis]|uniref:Putative ATP12, ATP synthase F1-assembly protein n=1 Tax=Rosa chinensis TaxID=74649 RepID=A0A2P6S645_ROSCH|nr:putative ATP12, ATP synthase F1-assembly protein [Rosa chinensis]